MSKINFSVARVDGFKCPEGKVQAFLWDSKSPGLGLRATGAGAKSYIFQGKLNGQSLRTTIGDPRSWTIEQAQEEARRLQRQIDTGIDPRVNKAELAAAELARKAEVKRLDVTFGEAWDCYVENRKEHWSSRHYQDHIKLADIGHKNFKRGSGITLPGPLSVLRLVRLVELNSECIANWLQVENVSRPTVTALAYRLLRAFIRWSHDTPEYKGLISENVHNARQVRERVSRSKAKEGDCLQKEQLKVWFAAVRKIDNPVQSVYLQGLLIAGARREEWAALLWENVDFKWNSIKINDKVEENGRVIPLTPYLATLLLKLKGINETPPDDKQLARMKEKGIDWTPSHWVFTSNSAADGKIVEPRIAHNKALAEAELPHLTLHGLRRSFGTLAEWVECPTGVIAQIMGHKPSAIAEKHYRRRSIDLLRQWHNKIEEWMLMEAGINTNDAANKAVNC